MHMHIAFAYAGQRLVVVARRGDGSEIAMESQDADVSWCLYHQALARALNMAVSWRAKKATLYTHQAAGDERCDGWIATCERLTARIPDGVEYITIPAERNPALRLAETWG